MQAFVRLTQSKVLPLILCCRGHGQSDRQRGRIKDAGEGGRGGGGIGFTVSSGIREHCKLEFSQELLNVFQGK